MKEKSLMDEKCMPVVSVIIPCYNQGEFLYEAVASAYNAYSHDLDIIVVNDGSNDSQIEGYFREILLNFPKVRIIHQENKGLSAARNTGIENAKGEYIQFLDADDLLFFKKIDNQMRHFFLSDTIDVSITHYILANTDLSKFWLCEDSISGFDLNLDDFLFCWERGFVIPIHCALFSKAVFQKIMFNTKITAKEDWVFWSSLVFENLKIALLPLKAGVVYRQHINSMRKSVLNMAKSWVSATMTIDEMVKYQRPNFFESSISWLNQFYRRQKEYIEEINEKKAIHEKLEIYDTKEEEKAVDFEKFIEKMNSMLQPPLITIVLPVYNHYSFLQYCFDSIARQIYDNYEIVIIDDNSTDMRIKNSLNKIVGKSARVKVILHDENQGIIKTLNEGIDKAEGKYIALVDCDDALREEALLRAAHSVEEYEVDYLFTDRYDINAENKVIRKAVYGGYENIKPSGNIKMDLLDGMIASHLKVIKKEKYLLHMKNSEKFDGIQDWQLALAFCDNGAHFHYLPEALYEHRIHTGSVTSSAHVKQMRKTNKLRRIFQERWYGERTFLPKKFFSGETLSLDLVKRFWREGFSCEVILSEKVELSEINWLREYNSYFEKVVCEGKGAYYSLLGYMWNEKKLIYKENI